MRTLPFLILLSTLFISPSIQFLHTGSCLGSICGRNGHCHQGPPQNGSQTFWCRCNEGYGGLFCDRECDLKCGSADQKCVFDNENVKTLCVCKDCDKNGNKLPSQPDCPAGFGGEKCNFSGWCHPGNCKNGGKCIGDGNEARCACPDGFRGKKCEFDVNECEANPEACGPRSTCMNTNGSYLCVCPQGFLPPDCLQPGNTSTVEFKPAVCFLEISPESPNGQSMYCQNTGHCVDSTCICPPGYHGSTCEFTPEQQDPCASNPCIYGTCSSFAGGFQCLCDDGFSGSYCQEGKDHCMKNKCEAGSQCINNVDSYFCDCPPGRTGQYCEKLDCSAIPGICNHGACIDSPLSEKSFECQCDPGYEGELCDTDKNECLSEHMCMNNGTCVNLDGSFRCDCARGFGGKWCDVPLDMCQDARCENGGICMHTLDRSPVCQCRNGFIGKRCEKECPFGFGGVRCDLRMSDGICSRRGAKCYNGGKCSGGFCICPPDFTGNQCEVSRRDVTSSGVKCQSDPCMNNATCIDVDAHIGYACICQQGFEGDICEKRKDLCLENPCGNGGVCHQNRESFTCDCPSGFRGERCEHERRFICNNNTCQNGGICIQSGKISKCECSYGFTGVRCEEKINLGMFSEKDSLLRSVCEKRKCWERANDGNCDADCNYSACKFDGGDCSGKREPFSKCRYGNMCADLFANGECNQACNNEECLYDGMDCMPAVIRCPAKIREYCASRFANGVCDAECNTIGCGFDGGDCDSNSSTILTNIRLTVQMDPSEFQSNGGSSLMEISSALRATVRIQRDEIGPLVFGWDGENEKERVQMDVKKLTELRVLSTSIRKVRSVSEGVVVYLEVQENCEHHKCLYKDAQTVVDIISARLAKKGIDSFGVPISEALVATPRRAGDGSTANSMNNFVLAIGAICLMTVVLAGTITLYSNRTRKRRMINAPVWIPPMENEEKNRRNQSINSSQHTLLDAYSDPKRHRGDYQPQEQPYNQFYAQPYRGNDYGGGGDGYITDFDGNGNLRATVLEELHRQAYGPGPIMERLTEELVNAKDEKYNRTVLHFLAANKSGKDEELIVEEAKRCLEAGANVDELDSDCNTPLLLAVRSRRTRLALVLLHARADPTHFNECEKHALHEAAYRRDHRMMEILLTDKRIIRDIEELDRNGMTALMMVARLAGEYQVQMARLLISKGAKIDSDGAARKDSDKYKGRTALHYAALHDNIPMVEFLVCQNANKDKQDEDGRTPIMLASMEGNETVVRYLLASGASIEAVDALDRSARMLASINKHQEVVRILDTNDCRTDMSFAMEMSLHHHPHQQIPPASTRKTARSTYKSVKKQAKPKKESSRDSTHLTPPPSDGSTSSPSPQHFLTAATHTTPPSLHYLSPEYPHDVANSDSFQPQCSTIPNGEMWFTASPMQNETMGRYADTSYHY